MSEQLRDVTLRRAEQRGRSNFGWLNSFHTFSFGAFNDPRHMGFGALRVINDDTVAPGAGFGEHGHRDMEIITWVLNGALEHRDSLGNGSVIRPGEVQVMSAGTGIRHSEFNASKTEPVHFLQIWIIPERDNLPPRYEQKTFPLEQRTGKLCLIASGKDRNADGSDSDAARIFQDVAVYSSILEPQQAIEYDPEPGRRTWIQVARGDLSVGGHELRTGDGLAITDAPPFSLRALRSTELLLFDLA